MADDFYEEDEDPQEIKKKWDSQILCPVCEEHHTTVERMWGVGVAACPKLNGQVLIDSSLLDGMQLDYFVRNEVFVTGEERSVGRRVKCDHCDGTHWIVLTESSGGTALDGVRMTMKIEEVCPFCDENGMMPVDPQPKGILNVTGVAPTTSVLDDLKEAQRRSR